MINPSLSPANSNNLNKGPANKPKTNGPGVFTPKPLNPNNKYLQREIAEQNAQMFNPKKVVGDFNNDQKRVDEIRLNAIREAEIKENARKRAIHEQQMVIAIKKQNEELLRIEEAKRKQIQNQNQRNFTSTQRTQTVRPSLTPKVQTTQFRKQAPLQVESNNKRDFIKKASGVAGGILASTIGSIFVGKKIMQSRAGEESLDSNKIEELKGIDREFARWFLEKTKENKFKVMVGDFVGKAFGGTGKILTSSEGKLNQEHLFDSLKALNSAWGIKAQSKGLSELAAKNKDRFMEEFKGMTKHKMTVQQYSMNIDEVLRRLKVDFDFEKFGAAFNLNGAKIELLKRIMNKVDARAMIAYALTEIGPVDPMDERKGLVPDNIKLLDFALRTGGSEFLDFIPSMHDNLLSFGPYQLTRFAVGNSPLIDSKNETKRNEEGKIITKPDGALIANKFIRGGRNKISTRIGDIRGAEHHRAAWLLAAVHVALVLRKLDEGRVALIENEFTKFDTLVGFLGACHNKMSCTNDFAKWLNSGARGTPVFESDVYKHYKRSVNNAKAIERFGLNISYDSESKRKQP